MHDLYCSHCGQKAKAERITFRYLCTETIHLFTHIEEGFLFTSGSMLVTKKKYYYFETMIATIYSLGTIVL
jgi:hypothetical protein